MLSIKRRIAKEENLTNIDNIALYLCVEDDVPTDDSERVKLSQDRGPGSSPDAAIGLLITAAPRPQATNIRKEPRASTNTPGSTPIIWSPKALDGKDTLSILQQFHKSKYNIH